MRKILLSTILTLSAFIFIFASFFYFIDNSKYKDTIHYGVFISGVDISGMNRSDAVKKITEIIDKKINKNIIIYYGSHNKIISNNVIKPEVDVYSYVNMAFNVNRNSSFFLNTISSIALFFRPVNIEPSINFDDEAIIDEITDFASKENVPKRDARLKIRNGKPIIEDDVIGHVIDVNKTYEKVISALLVSEEETDVNVECSVNMIMPTYTSDQIMPLQKEITGIINGLALSSEINSDEDLKIDTIFDMASRDGVIFLSVDKKALNSVLDIQKEKLVVSTKEARFIENDPFISIDHGTPGVSVNKSVILWDSKRGSGISDGTRAKGVYKYVLPDFNNSRACNLDIFSIISTHTEYFNPHQINRVHNIRLLAKILDGMLLAPGEIFSFNDTTGPRSMEKGFLLAPQIRNGRLVDAYGGGICNIATTIFNTAFLGGYEIVDRKPHQFYISHYPAGRDATVDFGLVDFKFKNDTKSWILIKTSSTQSSVTITFYSTDPGRIVRFETEKFTNYRPHTVEYVPDPSILPGTSKKIEDGVSGCDITVIRYVIKDGSEKIEEFFSRYYPKNTIILVNPGEVPEK